MLKKVEELPHKKICAYCQIEKPDKARHCFICKRCVLEHDKHSFFLNNCIGKENRAFVIAYLLSTSVLLSCIILSALLHFTNVIGYD
jgi:predicted amidophosphoribosyltransferase